MVFFFTLIYIIQRQHFVLIIYVRFPIPLSHEAMKPCMSGEGNRVEILAKDTHNAIEKKCPYRHHFHIHRVRPLGSPVRSTAYLITGAAPGPKSLKSFISWKFP